MIATSGFYPINIGGPASVGYFLAKEFGKCGNDVTVFIRVKDKEELHSIQNLSEFDDLVNVEVASPSGLTCWDDNIHFTSDSQRIYGFRYAEKMMEMVGTRVSDADISRDGSVDWVDLGLIADEWLEFSDYGDSKDINNDAHIDVYDFVIMGQQCGQ